MSGFPPVTGPITCGTATAPFNGRVEGVVGAGAVVVGVDEFDDDEQPPAHASASTLNAAIAGRVLTIAVLPRASATLDDLTSRTPVWPPPRGSGKLAR